MPRKLIRRFIPDRETLRKSAAIRGLGSGWRNPQVWHLNRRSVAGAVAIGLFIGWLPIPMQMLLAAFIAVLLHVNLPVSVLFVWISNPLTFPALLYAGYRTGAYLLGWDIQLSEFEPNFAWFMQSLRHSWQPIFAGCLFLGALSAILGYFLTHLLWRLALLKQWQQRRKRKPRVGGSAISKP